MLTTVPQSCPHTLTPLSHLLSFLSCVETSNLIYYYSPYHNLINTFLPFSILLICNTCTFYRAQCDSILPFYIPHSYIWCTWQELGSKRVLLILLIRFCYGPQHTRHLKRLWTTWSYQQSPSLPSSTKNATMNFRGPTPVLLSCWWGWVFMRLSAWVLQATSPKNMAEENHGATFISWNTCIGRLVWLSASFFNFN